MKKIMFAVAFLSLMLTTTLVEAQTYRRHPQARQNVKINQGVRNGSLTRAEARQLHRQQARIHQMKRMARADGRVTPMERHRIHMAERRADVAIYHKKHNPYRRY